MPPNAEELARAFLNRRYVFPGDSDAEKYQTAVREARRVIRALLAEREGER